VSPQLGGNVRGIHASWTHSPRSLAGQQRREQLVARKTGDYLAAWLRICRNRPDVNFYAYTKEVRRFRRLVEPDPPPNLLWVYSYGYLSGLPVVHELRL
jgi:hypothetical protein